MNTQKLINTMDNDIAKSVQSFSAKVLSSLVKKTPVDHGCAENNWNLSHGKIDFSTVDCKRNPALNVDVLKTITGKKDVYITNSLPYIKALENGHSKQAPKGMVALTVGQLKNL
jgi:hypothetical protein